MSLLKSITTDSSIKGETDSLGGGVVDSGLYNATVGHAYVTTAQSEAMGLVCSFKLENGREVRETFWMTSGKEKGKRNFYEKDGQRHYLPGFLQANALALLAVGKEINELDTEEKVIKVYSSDAKAEVPTKVQMVMELVGKPILLGVMKQIEDKTKKNETTNQYEPTGETRETNTIDKIFNAESRLTVAEIKAGTAADAEEKFADAWSNKNAGKVRDRSTKTGGTAGAPGKAPGAAPGSGNKPKTSLFGGGTAS